MTTPTVVRYAGIEYGTERPCEIARISLDNGDVLLAFRYTDDGGDWFPTWIGPVDHAVKLPDGFKMPAELVRKFLTDPS